MPHFPRFSDLIQPLETAAFLQDIYGQKPFHFVNPEQGPEARQRFCSLFNWDSLNQLLSFSPNLPLRILKGPLSYIYQRDERNPKAIMDELRAGGTLILNQIQDYDAQLGSFLDGLSSELLSRFALNLYLSIPGHGGYPIHFDSHDFLILQVYGYKQWEIYPRTLAAPLQQHDLPDYSQLDVSQQPPGPESILHSLQMSPGDVLYVPKGYWHRAQAQKETSLHLTLGFYPATGESLLQWIFDIVKAQGLPEELPLLQYSDLPTKSGQSSPYAAQLSQLQMQIERVVHDSHLLRHYHQHQVQAISKRQAFALPTQYLENIEHISGSVFQRVSGPLALFETDAGHLELCYPYEKLNFAPAARELLLFILEHTQFTRHDLEQAFPEIPWPGILEVLLPLLQDGLLRPA